MAGAQAIQPNVPLCCVSQFAHKPADGSAQLQRPTRPIAVPERHLPQLARRRRHHHSLESDVDNAPSGRTQQERLAYPGLVHHLLVELAHTRAIGQEHAEQSSVGDRSGVGDCQALGASSASDHPGGPVPHDARPQL